MSGPGLNYENLLVTGGCGFIGANFIRYLFSSSDFSGRIINLDKLTYAGNPLSLADIETRYPDRYIFVKGDIVDRQVLQSIFLKYHVDGVCHFAAESHVDRSIKKPADFIQTNIIGTFHLLEEALSYGKLKRFHHISTDEVFGSLGNQGSFTEATPYSPNSPYSASKASSDHLVRAYHKTFGLPISISNCSNNYGPYQFPEKLIPLMILQGYQRKPLPVYGDGRNVRDWLFVTDHCEAIWLIMRQGETGQTYVIGGEGERQNLYIVHQICDILDKLVGEDRDGSRRQLIRFVPDRPGHDWRYAIDFTFLRTHLGWTPRETLDSGLIKTVQWYLDNQTWVNQIQSGEYLTWIQEHYGDNA